MTETINFNPEDEARQQGIRNLLRFLEKTCGAESINDQEKFTEILSKLDYDQFKNLLLRINWLICNIPMSERSGEFHQSAVSQGGWKDWLDYVPPDPTTSEEILSDTFWKMKDVLGSDDPESDQTVALTIFNSVIYLHLFKDGNGRSARLFYTMFTPRKKEFLEEELGKLLEERPQELGDYHTNVNVPIYYTFLRARGIDIDDNYFDREKNDYKYRLENSKMLGFDNNALGFISAMDVMTDEEKEKFAHRYPNEQYFYFVFDDLPEELQNRIKKQQNETRKNFAIAAIDDLALDPNNWEGRRQDPLDKAWGYNSKANTK